MYDEMVVIHCEFSTYLPTFFMGIPFIANFQITKKIQVFNRIMNCAFRRISAIIVGVFLFQ